VAQVHDWPGPKAFFHVKFAGGEEDIPIRQSPNRPDAEVAAMTRDDLLAMMRMARARGIPMYLITYSRFGPAYRVVNEAIATVSAEFGVPYIDAAEAARAAAAVAPGERLFDGLLHPMPIVYGEVAEEVYRTLVREGRVPPLQ
jgi:hypothetical protein